ncbi:MAG: MgtC/SapB family protein [Candidatus Aenigmatarchaeota archaeon]
MMMLTTEIIIRLLLSVIFGIIIGFEREIAHKPAGLRTYALISLGSCLFTLISIYYFPFDPARIIAGMVGGIGFIGAGIMIASKNRIRGITTAASLWCITAVGISVGVGAYALSFTTTIIIFILLQLKKAEKKLKKR